MEYNFNHIWEKCLPFNIEQKPEEFKKLLDFLSKNKNKKYALEIGSNYGGTSFGLCHLYEYVISIDIKHHDNFDKIKTQFPNYNYIISDSKSNDTVNYIKSLGIKFDFIFIDGDHSYNGVKNDYEKYKQFLADDGYMAFHDIIKSEETEKYDIYVSKFWNEIKPYYKKNYEFIVDKKDDSYRKDNEFHQILKNQVYGIWGGIGLIENHKVSVFVHNYLDKNWYDIVQSQINKLVESGLYKRADKIFYGVYSFEKSDFNIFYSLIKKYDSDMKIELVMYEKNNFEFDTLIHLQNYCNLNPNGSVIYFHTKGVSRDYNANINSWRECLEYFVIEKWSNCLRDLLQDKADICGALYVNEFKFLNYKLQNYFSGNFWWSKANYINKLPSIVNLYLHNLENRTIAELWLGMSPHVWISYYGENVSSWYDHYFDSKNYKVN
jgi:predicted O-methyltransferase YrrM